MYELYLKGSVVVGENLVAEKIRETAMVDLAFEKLKGKGEPILYRELLSQIAGQKGFTEEDVERYIAQLYTEINTDGRFICVGKSLWGLKSWYPIEQSTDAAVAANVKDDVDSELDEEDIFDDDNDNFTDELDDLESMSDFHDEQDSDINEYDNEEEENEDEEDEEDY